MRARSMPRSSSACAIAGPHGPRSPWCTGRTSGIHALPRGRSASTIGARPSVGSTIAAFSIWVRYRQSDRTPRRESDDRFKSIGSTQSGTKVQSRPSRAAFARTAPQRRSRSATEYPFQVTSPGASIIRSPLVFIFLAAPDVGAWRVRAKLALAEPPTSAMRSLGRHDAVGPLEEPHSAPLGHHNVPAPDELHPFVLGHPVGLEHPGRPFLDAHVTNILATGPRREQRPVIVADTAPVHEDQGLHASLGPEAVHKVDQVGECRPWLHIGETGLEHLALQIDDLLQCVRRGTQQDWLVLLRDLAAPYGARLVRDVVAGLQPAPDWWICIATRLLAERRDVQGERVVRAPHVEHASHNSSVENCLVHPWPGKLDHLLDSRLSDGRCGAQAGDLLVALDVARKSDHV